MIRRIEMVHLGSGKEYSQFCRLGFACVGQRYFMIAVVGQFLLSLMREEDRATLSEILIADRFAMPRDYQHRRTVLKHRSSSLFFT